MIAMRARFTGPQLPSAARPQLCGRYWAQLHGILRGTHRAEDCRLRDSARQHLRGAVAVCCYRGLAHRWLCSNMGARMLACANYTGAAICRTPPSKLASGFQSGEGSYLPSFAST